VISAIAPPKSQDFRGGRDFARCYFPAKTAKNSESTERRDAAFSPAAPGMPGPYASIFFTAPGSRFGPAPSPRGSSNFLI
jgi:hypothetical protein